MPAASARKAGPGQLPRAAWRPLRADGGTDAGRGAARQGASRGAGPHRHGGAAGAGRAGGREAAAAGAAGVGRALLASGVLRQAPDQPRFTRIAQLLADLFEASRRHARAVVAVPMAYSSAPPSR